MLVLTRQRDEVIVIGDGIEITVVDIRGDRVRIGVSAPPNVRVDRKEVREAIERDGLRGDQAAKLRRVASADHNPT